MLLANGLSNLGWALLCEGKYNKANNALQQTLELYKRVLGEDHPSVATSLNNLAELYRAQGRY